MNLRSQVKHATSCATAGSRVTQTSNEGQNTKHAANSSPEDIKIRIFFGQCLILRSSTVLLIRSEDIIIPTYQDPFTDQKYCGIIYVV